MQIIYTNGIKLTDLNVYECGMQKCSSDYNYGPAIREFFLIHYIFEGKGFLKVGNKTYYLEKGKGFLICPETVVHYRADHENPWHYAWIAFQGIKAESFLCKVGINNENPVFQITDFDGVKNCFNQMMLADKLKSGRELYLVGLLYQMLSILVEEYSRMSQPSGKKNRKDYYINTAVRFIQSNYGNAININQIASHVGLDGKYLSAIFHEHLHTSPHRFLMETRIDKACEIMSNELLTIGDVSRSVGYNDPLLFSRMFKRIKGVSPREYRKTFYLSN